MTETAVFDVVLVGGGPGGVAAASGLAERGLTVAVVEDRLIGGECHFWACNPTKSLLRPVEVLGLARAVPGVRELVHGDHPDLVAVFAKRDTIIEHRTDAPLTESLRASGIEVFHGRGRLSGPRHVVVSCGDSDSATLRARHAVVLATGTRPVIPDVPGLAEAQPWTNRELAWMERLPRRILVLGGGVVGVESATILAGLGADVTVLARGDGLLPNAEPFAAEMVEKSLREKGVRLRFGAELSRVSRPDPGGPVTATFGDQNVEVDEIVVAAGRVVNTNDLGLTTVGLADGDYVPVDDHLQAVGVDGGWLYAIGDTTGRALLSHISQYHGRLVADVIAARAQRRDISHENLEARDRGNLAQVIFTDPQVVEVGLTEARARKEGRTVTTRTAHYPGALTQLAILRDGFDAQAKLVIDAETDALIGATFVGPEVSELVHAATMAVVAKVPLSVLRHVVAPHPSLNQVWDPLVAPSPALASNPKGLS